MNIQRPLFWHQGLFLQPQHFQLLDLYFRSLLSPFNNFMQPYFWGVGDCEIQTAALENQSFNLNSCELLFPDGTYTVFPGNAMIEGRSFEQAWVEGGKPFTVYIGLKKWDNAGKNVTVLSKLENLAQTTTRFITTTDPETIDDLHEGGIEAHVKSLYYALKIFWEKEKDRLGDYITIPIAQLVRRGDEVVLSENYIPPCLNILKSKPLMKLVKDLRDQISARCHQLEEYKIQRGIHTAEFGSRDMVFLLALRSLNRYVPLLFHFTETHQVHPWSLYGLLRQLVGELSSFSSKYNVLGELSDGTRLLPSYDHKDIWECFSSAQNMAIQLLDEITAGPEYIINLLFDGTYYTADLDPGMFEGLNRYYMILNTESDPKDVIKSLTNIAKLSSREDLPLLIVHHLSGIGLTHLMVPPQELPKRAHSIYFQIDHNSDKWAKVEKERNIAIYWDNAPEDLKIELMVIRRSG